MYTVYMHVNRINNKKYIGQTKQNVTTRWGNGHTYKTSTKFNAAINKYGFDAFNHFIIKDGLSKFEADELEVKLILYYDTTNVGYNISVGGSGVMTDRHHTKATKKLIATKRREQVFTDESFRRRASTMYGFEYYGIIAIDKQGVEYYYKSVSEFCKEYNGSTGHVNKCLRGIRKTHKGFRFKFAKQPMI